MHLFTLFNSKNKKLMYIIVSLLLSYKIVIYHSTCIFNFYIYLFDEFHTQSININPAFVILKTYLEYN